MQVEQLTAALNPVAAALFAAGGKDALTLVDQARARFDEELGSEPQPESRMSAIRRELGVA